MSQSSTSTKMFRARAWRARSVVMACLGAALLASVPAAAGPLGSIGGALKPALKNQFIAERAPTLAPMGHVIFCTRQPSECRAGGGSAPVSLTNRRMDDLRAVNAGVNRAVRGVNDGRRGGIGDQWQVAVSEGDCEDYALAKRKDLLGRGWAPGALRIAVARTPSGIGHAVLVVRTSSGDLVLDNRHDRILPWRSTDLRWIKIQSASDPRRWFSI